MGISSDRVRQIIREEITRIVEGWEGGGSLERGRHGPEGLGAETDDTHKSYRAMADHDRRKRELEAKKKSDERWQEVLAAIRAGLPEPRTKASKEAALRRISHYEDMLDIHHGSIMKAFPDRDPHELEDVLVARIKEKWRA